jgi:CheY-like chemotaxis protein
MQLAEATVLVVDDEKVLCEIMSAWFKRYAGRALRASDGQEALRLLAENRVDVMISDVRMPVMDGVALLRAVAASGASRPRLIFVTGFADLSSRDAYDLGVEAIVEKPLERDHLLKAVQHCLTERNELWRQPLEFMPDTVVQESFASMEAALHRQQIAFGHGGFCLYTRRRLREAPIHFELVFQAEDTIVSGEGMVRWSEPAQNLSGVEILHLDDKSRGWIAELAENKKLEAYIPRSPNQDSAVGSPPSAVSL